jgi:hypothetical protein
MKINKGVKIKRQRIRKENKNLREQESKKLYIFNISRSIIYFSQ